MKSQIISVPCPNCGQHQVPVLVDGLIHFVWVKSLISWVEQNMGAN